MRCRIRPLTTSSKRCATCAELSSPAEELCSHSNNNGSTSPGTEIELDNTAMKTSSIAVAYSAVLLMLPLAGCASHRTEPQVAQPQAGVTQPKTPEPVTQPQEPAASTPTAASPAPSEAAPAGKPSEAAPAGKPAPAPAPSGATQAPKPATAPAPNGANPAPKAATKTAPPVAKTPSPPVRPPTPAAPAVASTAAAPLDLTALKEKLKATKAIGVFTKISLKNQVDDLMKQFSDYYQGKAKTTMPELRRSYDLLLMKVLSLLQDSDQKLASEVVSSREAIWGLLSDPKKFATLQG